MLFHHGSTPRAKFPKHFKPPLKETIKHYTPEPALVVYRAIKGLVTPPAPQRVYPFITEATFGYKTAQFKVHTPLEYVHAEETSDEAKFRQRFICEVKKNQGPVAVIGAAEGFYVIGAAIHDRAVYGFEPDQRAWEHLSENIVLNDHQISAAPNLFQLAISDQCGEMDLCMDPTYQGVASLTGGDGRTESTKIPVSTIDSLIAKGQIDSPRIVLMDIEGEELQAIEGMRELLKGSSPPTDLFIEIHPQRIKDKGRSFIEINCILDEAGYELQWSQRRGTELLTHYRRRS